MATSSQPLRNRAALKIVETQELVLESRDGAASAAPRQAPGPDVQLNVPSTAGEFLEASVAEDGGAASMGTRRGSQHQYRAVLHEAIVRVAGALDSQGVCDTNGRLRRSWISELNGLIREARAIDELLGLGKTQPEAESKKGTRRATLAIPSDPENILPDEIEAFLDRMDLGPVDPAR
jgi:hypothetical protein